MDSVNDKISTAGETLKACRLYKGWTQRRLESKSGIARTLIGGYERGKYEPSVFNFVTLLNTMGFDIKLCVKGASDESNNAD